MRIHSPLFVLGALGLLGVAGPALGQVDTSAWKCSTCPYAKGVSGTVEAGVGAVSDDSARFGDFTGLQRQGAHLVLGGSVSRRGDDGYFADLAATDLGLDTRTLAARSGREGLYTLRLGYADIPRYLSSGAVTPFVGIGGGVLTLPADFRAADDTRAMPLATFSQPVQLGTKRSRLDVAASWIGVPDWTYRVGLRRDTRDGTQPIYGSFFADAAQLAAPVDQVTDQFEVAASYVGRGMHAMLAYQVSTFRNGEQALTWANPFTPLFTGGSTGQLALAPDNEFQQLTGSAGYELTPQIRASADFAVGRMKQDAAFLDPTLNTSLPVTRDDLPASSLAGRVDTFNGSARVTAQATPSLRLAASYARDVRDNRTAIRSFPAVVTDALLGPVERSNLPYRIIQDRIKLGADYRGPGSLKASAGAEFDQRERSYQEAVTTRETTLWGRVAGQARDDLSLALKLAHAQRDHSRYGVATWLDSPQNPLLRKANLAERQRDSASLRADYTASETISLGLTADFARDDYGRSAIGLTDGRRHSTGVDLSVAFTEKTRLQVFAHNERTDSRQAGSQTFAAPDWTARTRDRVELLGLGLQHVAMADKLDLAADVTRTRGRSDVAVDTGVSTTPLFPSAGTSVDSVRLRANYKLNEQLSLSASYWYEDYDAKDWHYDGVLPDTVSNLLTLGEPVPRYRVNVVRLALRYRF
jgi:MtrB/PioB family decaheme-associated outer membrane protein